MIENLETNLHHHQHHVEDDVGVDGTLPVLPDPVDADGEEACPDKRQDEGDDWDDRVKIAQIYDDIQGVAEIDEAADHLN